jgi:site-specific recombinase XerD
MGKLADKSLFVLVSDFLTVFLPKEKKCSAHTIRAYKKALDMFFEFVKLKNKVALRNLTFIMIDRQALLSFLDYLETERGCSVSTRNHRLQCIRAFFRYASEVEITAVVYWEEIKKVPFANAPETPVVHMSETAVKTIIAQPNVSTQKGLRDMFLMVFLYQTGARIQEILDVKLNDIQFSKTPVVTLYGKPNSKMRTVPLRDNAAEHLKGYINTFHPKENFYSDQYLFFTVRNGHKKRMAEDNARSLISKYGELARKSCTDVPEKVHPHLFRHSRAMHLYQHGVELTLISQWLGHAQLETTLIYAYADTEAKRRAIDKSVPDDSPLREHFNAERYTVNDDDVLRQLCGLK